MKILLVTALAILQLVSARPQFFPDDFGFPGPQSRPDRFSQENGLDGFLGSNGRNGFDWDAAGTSQAPRRGVFPRQGTTQRPQTSSPPVPGMETTRSACEDLCQITPQYSPVCGTNNISYSNEARLRCAQRCGRTVQLLHIGVCSIPPPRG